MSLLRSEADRTGTRSPSGVLATLSICNQTASVAGPAVGGLLIGVGGWHWLRDQRASVPGLSRAGRAVSASTTPAMRAAETGVVGVLLFAASLTAFVLFRMHAAAARWYLPVLGLIGGAAFARREINDREPFLDLRVLGDNMPLLATYARQLLTCTASYAYL